MRGTDRRSWRRSTASTPSPRARGRLRPPTRSGRPRCTSSRGGARSSSGSAAKRRHCPSAAIGRAMPADDAEWARVVEDLHASHRWLVAAVKRLTEADLERLVGEGREAGLGSGVTVAVMLHGIVAHDIYHAGQIALLRKKGARARPAGLRRLPKFSGASGWTGGARTRAATKTRTRARASAVRCEGRPLRRRRQVPSRRRARSC